MTALEHCLKHNTTLQALGISWNDTGTVYVYTAGINNTCYLLNKIWPLSKWINNTVQVSIMYASTMVLKGLITGYNLIGASWMMIQYTSVTDCSFIILRLFC